MRRLSALAALAAAASGCANQVAPAGGPPDPVPPRVVAVSPDSGAVGVRPSQVVFSFDEVVNERPARGGSLAQVVEVSPYQGDPDVRWHRDRLSVRVPGGWRDSTVYVVTLLPNVADLRNNILDSSATTVFSTGGPIPDTRVTGVVFDWAAGAPSRGALVQALVARGRDTTRYVAHSDSSGRFRIPYVPAGQVLVRGVLDENRNYIVDRREGWDTTSVALADSAFVELYAFVHDTVGPSMREVTVRDSMTVRLDLTRPLALDQRLDTSLVTLLGPDSLPIPLAAVLTIPAADSLAAAERAAAAAAAAAAADTTRRADSAAVAPPPPEPTPAAPPAAAPADSTRPDSARRLPPPVPSRPTPLGAIAIRTAVPLSPGTRYLVRLNGARGLDGPARTSERTFTTPARDTTRPPPASPPSPASPPPPPATPPASGAARADSAPEPEPGAPGATGSPGLPRPTVVATPAAARPPSESR